MSELDVWINGGRAGTWTAERESHRFQYDVSWVRSARAVPLSLQFPLDAKAVFTGNKVRNFFDNLLPDSEHIRSRIGRQAQLSGDSAFQLLEAAGGDCAGGVQVLRPGIAPGARLADSNSAAAVYDIGDLFTSLSSNKWWPLCTLPSSLLAGAQEKVVMAYNGNGWTLPSVDSPSTHIIKIPLGLIGGSRRVNASNSVENEWVCAQILRTWGFDVAEVELLKSGRNRVLAVKRFDRVVDSSNGTVHRRHQEDFCQALGLSSHQKYESDGGPGMRACLGLLRSSSDCEDVSTFLLTQLAFCLLGATDGHAKNFSVRLELGGSFRLSPLYDVLSIYPYVGNGPSYFNPRKCGPAMVVRSKNAHRYFYTIHARHWQQLAHEYAGPVLWKRMLELVERVPDVLSDVCVGIEDITLSETFAAIAEGVSTAARRFLRESAGLT